MNQTHNALSCIWNRFQTSLFPQLREGLGELTNKQQQLIRVLEVSQVERHIPYVGQRPGRPPEDRCAIARAFVAKAVYNLPTTEVLLDQLKSDIRLRRLCGWERQQEIPSRATFSRAFTEFAETQLAERVHSALIETHLGGQLIGHISRDSTAIGAREKPEKKAVETTPPKKRGRPKKGEERIKEPTRLERQNAGMTLAEMKADLPTTCNVGTKRNSKGYKTSWTGYKLHIDAADGGIPVSCLLSSASLHDSQVAIPLAEITHRRVTNCYDLMDAAYDAPLIKQHSESLGHVPLIDENPRGKVRKAELEMEQKGRRVAGYKSAESIRYNERGTVERVNGRLKDEFGGRVVRVKGHTKVMAHLMFGIIALTVDQLMKFVE
ncbi:MAG: transposase [Sedimenticola sp.]